MKKPTYLHGETLKEDWMPMKDEQEFRIYKDLISDIVALEKRYQTIKNYLYGAEMEVFEVVSNLKAYRDYLNVINAHILTLYLLKSQKTKITWDSLPNNISTALDAISSSAHPSPRAEIIAAFNMSETRIEGGMNILATLKESL